MFSEAGCSCAGLLMNFDRSRPCSPHPTRTDSSRPAKISLCGAWQDVVRTARTQFDQNLFGRLSRSGFFSNISKACPGIHEILPLSQRNCCIVAKFGEVLRNIANCYIRHFLRHALNIRDIYVNGATLNYCRSCSARKHIFNNEPSCPDFHAASTRKCVFSSEHTFSDSRNSSRWWTLSVTS